MLYLICFLALLAIVGYPWLVAALTPSTQLAMAFILPVVLLAFACMLMCRGRHAKYAPFFACWFVLALIAAPIPFVTEKYSLGFMLFATAFLYALGAFVFLTLYFQLTTPPQRYKKLCRDYNTYVKLQSEMCDILNNGFTHGSAEAYLAEIERVDTLLAQCPPAHKPILKERADLTRECLKAVMVHKGFALPHHTPAETRHAE